MKYLLLTLSCVQCLFYTELPFAEDLRQFTFGSLPVEEVDAATQSINRKFTPTGERESFCVTVNKLMQFLAGILLLQNL